MDETTDPTPTIENFSVTKQPSRMRRWWIRHHFHIGLASTSGSAILIFIIGVVLLPAIFKDSSTDKEACTTIMTTFSSRSSRHPSLTSTTTASTSSTPRVDMIIMSEPLCAENAIWRREGVTVAGSGSGQPASSLTSLNQPKDLIVDDHRNLFIADSENHRIICWLKNASQGHIIAGTGAYGSWLTLLKKPSAIAASEDILFVSDLENYRILAFRFTIAAGSPIGRLLIGRYGSGSASNQINRVSSMVFDRFHNQLYLSDSGNDRILKFDVTSEATQLIMLSEQSNTLNESLHSPSGMAIDSQIRCLYVADSLNNRIVKFDLETRRSESLVAGNAEIELNRTRLNRPSGLTLDQTGNLYIADTENHRILQWLADSGRARIILGTGSIGNDNDQLNSPVQVRFDNQHNLYVVDQNNHRIQRFDLLSNGC